MLMKPLASLFRWRHLLVAGLGVLTAFATGLAPAGQNVAPMTFQTVASRSDLRKLQSWTETEPIDVVARPTVDGRTRIERVTPRTVTYRPNSQMSLDLSAIATQSANNIFVVRAGQTFYLSEEDELLGCMVDAGGLTIVRSIFKHPKASGGISEAIAKFSDDVDEASLMRAAMDGTWVDLRRGAPMTFFTSDSRNTSQIGIPTVVAIDFDGDMFRLDLRSPGGRHSGQFWIDLSTQRLRRSMVDGKETIIP